MAVARRPMSSGDNSAGAVRHHAIAPGQSARSWAPTATRSAGAFGPCLSITEKGLGHIFEPLYTTKREGLGMGLAIARTIVNAHGGVVGAENNPEGGASLRFTLPVNREVAR